MAVKRTWLAPLFALGLLAGVFAAMRWPRPARSAPPSQVALTEERAPGQPCSPPGPVAKPQVGGGGLPAPAPRRVVPTGGPVAHHWDPWAGSAFPLDEEGVELAWLNAGPEIINCAIRWGQFEGRGVNGLLEVRFGVETNPDDGGTVTQVWTLDGGAGSTFLRGCIVSALAQAPFQTPTDGGVVLELPLQFVWPDEGLWPDSGLARVHLVPNSLGVLVFEAADGGEGL
jgi:hypothetical protein